MDFLERCVSEYEDAVSRGDYLLAGVIAEEFSVTDRMSDDELALMGLSLCTPPGGR